MLKGRSRWANGTGARSKTGELGHSYVGSSARIRGSHGGRAKGKAAYPERMQQGYGGITEEST
jgi:hypothetical protein